MQMYQTSRKMLKHMTSIGKKCLVFFSNNCIFCLLTLLIYKSRCHFALRPLIGFSVNLDTCASHIRL